MIMTGLCRLGRDAEVRHTGNGTVVATLALAYNYGKKGEDGNRPTQWISAALWGDRAETLAQYLLKGTQIDVALDEVHGESFERKDGGTGYSLRARVVSLEFSSKPAEQRGEPRPAREATPKTTTSKPAVGKSGSFEDMDDDIPF